MTEEELKKTREDTHAHRREVLAFLMSVGMELLERGETHDESKLHSPELEAFTRVRLELAEAEYGSDEYKAALEALGPALDHHYKNNRHHPEHYADGVAGMDCLDLVEMMADWIAASRRREGSSPHLSLEYNIKRFNIDVDGQLASVLRNTLNRLLELEREAQEAEE